MTKTYSYEELVDLCRTTGIRDVLAAIRFENSREAQEIAIKASRARFYARVDELWAARRPGESFIATARRLREPVPPRATTVVEVDYSPIPIYLRD